MIWLNETFCLAWWFATQIWIFAWWCAKWERDLLSAEARIHLYPLLVYLIFKFLSLLLLFPTCPTSNVHEVLVIVNIYMSRSHAMLSLFLLLYFAWFILTWFFSQVMNTGYVLLYSSFPLLHCPHLTFGFYTCFMKQKWGKENDICYGSPYFL